MIKTCIFLFFANQLLACTGVSLKSSDGSSVNGRTVEFATPIDMSAAVVPRKYQFVGDIPKGKGMKYISKYAAAGIYCFESQKLMDGINEKGLTAAAFYFPGYAEYATITSENKKKALSPAEFPNWILSQFATIDEVKSALKSVVIAPTVLTGWGNAPPPMHYIVYDKSGKSIVIEPIQGKLVVHENVMGVITNSPTFDWHLTNLNNYINLTPFNASPTQLNGLALEPMGQGSGMHGLPGDFTSPSRFVRIAVFSAAAIPSKNAQESVFQTFHILNQFDIPLGVVRESDQGKTHYDYTLLTSVKNPKDLAYFYKSFEDQAIKYIELKKFDLDAKIIKHLKTTGKQTSQDVSSLLN